MEICIFIHEIMFKMFNVQFHSVGLNIHIIMNFELLCFVVCSESFQLLFHLFDNRILLFFTIHLLLCTLRYFLLLLLLFIVSLVTTKTNYLNKILKCWHHRIVNLLSSQQNNQKTKNKIAYEIFYRKWFDWFLFLFFIDFLFFFWKKNRFAFEASFNAMSLAA